jgi:hypothetical protein
MPCLRVFQFPVVPELLASPSPRRHGCPAAAMGFAEAELFNMAVVREHCEANAPCSLSPVQAIAMETRFPGRRRQHDLSIGDDAAYN